MNIVVTGSAGFIGTHVAMHFAPKAEKLLLVDKVDLFKKHNYLQNIINADFYDSQIDHDQWMNQKIDLIVHMGAITNTAETDQTALDKWNTDYTKGVWSHCVENKIPLIYASSAATYGDGLQGFSDDHSSIKKLEPLNLYGLSKQKFDLWALEQKKTPPQWYGLKFFNVYGPYEAHKSRMASAVFHGFNEIKKTGAMTLFKSHNPKYKDGEQARDFIFVEDILSIMDFLLEKKSVNGIYNCGTGKAQTFKELSHGLFQSLEKPEKINWVETPQEFRKAYQYKTQADMTKLLEAGYKQPFTSLKSGISKYLTYLK